MANKINLITGETYTLGELFSGSRRIIIPDLQRDYCWGNRRTDEEPASLAEGFVTSLLEQFIAHPYGRLNLGLLYGYESPADYVQLCDGQQRITTLFLLIGMLNRWAGDDRYRHYLMSDFEFYDDDHEPYLQYSIRESSLYFLSDLVFRFFTHGDGENLANVKSIYDPATGQSCRWFYGEYATDPGIMSMLRCLETVERMRDRILTDEADRIERLMEFLVDRLTFIYYDMETRANGEETFVVINTTGEPLSATENLKPLIINSDINRKQEDGTYEVNGRRLSTAKAWEEMENYFWKNRRKDKYDTADNGFNEFLRWVTLLETHDADNQDLFRQNAKEDFDYSFPYKEISVAEIVEIFNVFVALREKYGKKFAVVASAGSGDKLDQKELFVFLPLVAYLRQQPCAPERQVERLANWLLNLIRIDNVNKGVNNLLSDVIRIGSTITDLVEILDLKGISSTILTEEERFKLEIIKKCPDESSRRRLEEEIWSAQDMRVDNELLLFGGEIRSLLLWATPDCHLNSETFDAEQFAHYLVALKGYLAVGEHTINDPTRRALLAWRYRGMPWGKSYGWGATWKDILASDPEDFRRFIDAAEAFGLEHIIRLDNTGNPLVRYPGILAYSDRKNFDTWTTSGYNVCQKLYAQPIPLPLAEIMARLGADVRRYATQECGNLNITLTKDSELVICPHTLGSRRFDQITVTVTDGGNKLRYAVKAPAYEFAVALPLASVETLCRRLTKAEQRVKDRRRKKKSRKRTRRG